MVSLTRGAHPAALFEIRVRGSDHDVVLIRGDPINAPSVLLTGSVVLSLTEPISVKRITLRLYADVRINWTDPTPLPRGTIPRMIRLDKLLFEQTWDNLEAQSTPTNTVISSAFSRSGGHSLHDSFVNLRQMAFVPPNGPASSSVPGSRSSSHPSSRGNSHGPSPSNSGTSLAGMAVDSAASGTTNGTTSGSANGSDNHYPLQHSSNGNIVIPGHSTAATPSTHTLPKGNHEFPFQVALPGNIPESVEGFNSACVRYRLHATVERGRFSSNLCTKKTVHVIRTLAPDNPELSETVAIENTWPGKVEYSISVAARAVAIGSIVPVSLLLVPLGKGLRLGNITVALDEMYQVNGLFGQSAVDETTVLSVTREPQNETECDDRWEVQMAVQLPASLSQCRQDVLIEPYVKIRHRLRFIVGLTNGDGHTSELRASLPITLFISPSVTIATSVDDTPDTLFPHVADGAESLAPPAYEEHIYDRLWSDLALASGLNTPGSSGMSTPFALSRNSSSEQLMGLDAQLRHQLSSRLQDLEQQRAQQERQVDSADSGPVTGEASGIAPEFPDGTNWEHLSRVPSYTTALKSEPVEDPAPSYERGSFSVPTSPRANGNARAWGSHGKRPGLHFRNSSSVIAGLRASVPEEADAEEEFDGLRLDIAPQRGNQSTGAVNRRREMPELRHNLSSSSSHTPSRSSSGLSLVGLLHRPLRKKEWHGKSRE